MREKYQETTIEETEKTDIISFLDDMIKRFKETWMIFLLIMLVGAAGGLLKEKMTYHETYVATASFVVSVGDQSNTVTSSYYNKISAEQMNATFPYILTSGALGRVVANDMGLDSVPGIISAEMLGDTNLFQIKVSSTDSQMAYDILQSVIKNYPEVAKYVIGDTKLKLLDESGVPQTPAYAPAYVQSMIKGLFAAIILCILILLVRVTTRSTVKNQEDLKRFLNVKYLCGIPQVQFKRRSSKKTPQLLVDNPIVPDIYTEALDVLQVRLVRELTARKMKTLLVTSALAGEGKTTTACNVAIFLAKKGYKVLLIDGDLRNPSVAKTLGINNGNGGLCNLLRGEIKAESLITIYQEDLPLHIIPGGEPVQRVGRLYTNGILKVLIEKYRSRYDYIIIDTPPSAIMSDASLIASYAEAGLMVIRQDYARRDRILTAAEVIVQTDTLLVGCAINGETSGIGSYGYGKYGYGRYGYGRYGYGRYGYGENKKKREEQA